MPLTHDGRWTPDSPILLEGNRVVRRVVHERESNGRIYQRFIKLNGRKIVVEKPALPIVGHPRVREPIPYVQQGVQPTGEAEA